MSIKQIFFILIILFGIDSVAMSQVKKQYQDDVDKSTTVVIKEEGANDFDILNSQFNLDDYKVNEQIKITTDQSSTLPSNTSNNVSGGQSIPPTAPDVTSATASASSTYERPKTKMKRWSVRPKKEDKARSEALEKSMDEDTIMEVPVKVVKKSTLKKSMRTAKRSNSKKYRKKSKKVKKKRRNKKLKNRKHKVKRNRKLKCYKF